MFFETTKMKKIKFINSRVAKIASQIFFDIIIFKEYKILFKLWSNKFF